MDAMQERNAAEEARRDVAAHPERSGRHEESIDEPIATVPRGNRRHGG